MAISFTDEEIEQDRMEAMEKIPEDNEPDGPFAIHEALDRAYLALEMMETMLLDHQTIVAHPEFYQAVHKIHTQLFNLYQDIGTLQYEKDKAK